MNNGVLAFLAALPELMKLIKNIQARIDMENQNAKVRDKLKEMNKFLEEDNAEALRDSFNPS